MAKTKEELVAIKKEFENLQEKLSELSNEELELIAGGNFWDVFKKMGEGLHSTTKPATKIFTPNIK